MSWIMAQANSLPVRLLVALILVPLGMATPIAQPKMEEDDRLVTRHGAVILEKGEGDLARWRIRLNDRTLVDTEDDELGLWELFEGDDGRDYVIIRRGSGGIACPAQFRVIEVGPKAAVRISDEFGSCVDPGKTRLYGDALVIEMRAYAAHPDLLSAAELRTRRQTVEIYTVRNGRVTKREEVRK